MGEGEVCGRAQLLPSNRQRLGPAARLLGASPHCLEGAGFCLGREGNLGKWWASLIAHESYRRMEGSVRELVKCQMPAWKLTCRQHPCLQQ